MYLYSKCGTNDFQERTLSIGEELVVLCPILDFFHISENHGYKPKVIF
jgi:hypothetical protein